MAYSLIKNKEEPESVIQLVDEALFKYPRIAQNSIIGELSFYKRLYLKLLLNRDYKVSTLLVRSYERLKCLLKIIVKQR